MYTLYYAQGTCSMAVHVLLNELGVPFELKEVSLSNGQNRSPEFLRLNSRGQVPVLKTDQLVLREGAAVLLYLLETHNSAWLPKSGEARARALEWLCFCNSTLHPAYGAVFGLKKMQVDEQAKAPFMDAAKKRIDTLWQDVETHLGGSAFLAGDTITIADILMTVIANWSASLGITLGSNVKRVLNTVISLPAYQKALQTEQVEYKAAA